MFLIFNRLAEFSQQSRNQNLNAVSLIILKESEDCELITTETKGVIAFSNTRLYPALNEFQHFIAGGMTIAIVDRFKFVEVDQQNG